MNTLIFILICYGACNNIIFGSMFAGFREFLMRMGTGGYSLYKLFTCFMCLGTWMGFAVSMIYMAVGIPLPITSDHTLTTIFLHGLLSTGSVWILHTLQEALERAFNK